MQLQVHRRGTNCTGDQSCQPQREDRLGAPGSRKIGPTRCMKSHLHLSMSVCCRDTLADNQGEISELATLSSMRLSQMALAYIFLDLEH